jgi:hypothetical protein
MISPWNVYHLHLNRSRGISETSTEYSRRPEEGEEGSAVHGTVNLSWMNMAVGDVDHDEHGPFLSSEGCRTPLVATESRCFHHFHSLH